MPKLTVFYKKHKDQTFNIRTRNNVKLMQGVAITTFFETIAEEFRGKRLPSFEDFYADITHEWIMEFKNDEPYKYKDWSERSQKEFRKISREFYSALL